jgi:hypothetical protein
MAYFKVVYSKTNVDGWRLCWLVMYGLNDLGFESREKEQEIFIFFKSSRTYFGPKQLPVQ